MRTHSSAHLIEAFQFAGLSLLLTREYKLVSVGVLENRRRSPRFLLRLLCKFHSLGLQRLGGSKHVICPERERLKSADPICKSVRGEQNDLRFSAWDTQFDPALRSERLVGHYAEAQFFGVELQGAILIASRNTSKFDTANHFQSPSRLVT